MIKNKKNLHSKIKALTILDFNRIVELEKTLVNEELCYKSYEKKIISSLNSDCSVGVYVDNLLIAYSLCFFTEYGTGEIEKCFVLNTYQGNGFQSKMLQENVSLLASKSINHIHTTVSPANEASLKSFQKAGFIPFRVKNIGKYPRIIMTKNSSVTDKDFVVSATKFVSQKCKYLYGGKGEAITVKYVIKMASLYPEIYNEKVFEQAINSVGQIGIDCSGLVTLSAKLPQMNSEDLLESIVERYSTADISKVENGMIIYDKNHVGIIHVDENNEGYVIEAKDFNNNLITSKLSERISAFECYGRLKGLSYENAKKLL